MINPRRLIIGCILLILMLTGCAKAEEYVPPETAKEMVATELATVETQDVPVVPTPVEYSSDEEELLATAKADLETEPAYDPITAPDPVIDVPVTEATAPIDARQASNYKTAKGYINANVKTSLTGKVYNANGPKVFSNGNLITDVSKFTSPQINSQMARTFFISDLSSSIEGNDTAIFIIGLVFKERKVNYDDTSEYYKQMVNVGAPCTVILKHMVKANKTYQLKVQQHAGIFTAKHYDTVINEIDHDASAGIVLLDFITPSILPHMTRSTDGKTLFYTSEINSVDNSFHMLSHIQLSRISTEPNINNFKYFYYPLSDYERTFKQYGYHHIDIHMFYMKIQPDGSLFLASIGQPDSVIATGFLFNTDTLDGLPGQSGRWKDRAAVMKMVTN